MTDITYGLFVNCNLSFVNIPDYTKRKPSVPSNFIVSSARVRRNQSGISSFGL